MNTTKIENMPADWLPRHCGYLDILEWLLEQGPYLP